MRTEQEMYDLIIRTAKEDERIYCETNPSEWSKKRKLSLSNFWNSINELNGRLMRQLQGLPNQVLLIS